jgi:cytidylate kinase
MDSRRIITVDGPAGSGKSTVARLVAARLGLPCLNSGLIYRAATLLALEEGADFADEGRMAALLGRLDLRFREERDRTRVVVGDRDVTDRLREPEVTRQVFRVANNGNLRKLLVDLQRRAVGPRGLVAEGRDMGTVIFPQAPHKFFLDAAPEVRARRQLRDLEAAGHKKSFTAVLQELLERDRHDRDRDAAPLRVAPGAIVIATDSLGIEDVVEKIFSHLAAAAGAAVANGKA